MTLPYLVAVFLGTVADRRVPAVRPPIVWPGAATTCQCAAPPDTGAPGRALAARVGAWRARPAGAGRVVLARVERVDTLNVTLPPTHAGFAARHGLVVARLRVLRVWASGTAAASDDTLTVGLAWAGAGATSCDVLLAPGEDYLVVPSAPAEGGVPWVQFCGGTRPRAQATAEREALGRGRAIAPWGLTER